VVWELLRRQLAGLDTCGLNDLMACSYRLRRLAMPHIDLLLVTHIISLYRAAVAAATAPPVKVTPSSNHVFL